MMSDPLMQALMLMEAEELAALEQANESSCTALERAYESMDDELLAALEESITRTPIHSLELEKPSPQAAQDRLNAALRAGINEFCMDFGQRLWEMLVDDLTYTVDRLYSYCVTADSFQPLLTHQDKQNILEERFRRIHRVLKNREFVKSRLWIGTHNPVPSPGLFAGVCEETYLQPGFFEGIAGPGVQESPEHFALEYWKLVTSQIKRQHASFRPAGKAKLRCLTGIAYNAVRLELFRFLDTSVFSALPS